ncbi:carbohydrate ABC transporter permease [Xylanimonas ulmi]|uniref:Carbohydrate ABC transporter membrane protein 1 (CUT1 family) n=1 Tax=Xylanimonas ulmi TaxID=228973 RepID=A0A4Q7M4R7_9MICO|nr:sugar ABC transporter permease [Xylanibacterium ulmi]RZS62965.1 carbohydrate ABC transporter membrane protein 1 (CUT1 family) [Xylanibacterium ulmi]
MASGTATAGRVETPWAVGRHAPSVRRTGLRALWHSPRRRKDLWAFLLLAGPNVALIVAFCWRPVVLNLQYATLDWTLGNQTARFVGLRNFVEFLTGEGGRVLWTTLLFTVFTVGGSMVLGLLLALVLNRRLVGTTFARSAVFAPFVLSGVGVGLVWVFIFDPTVGVLSNVMGRLHVTMPQWFLQPGPALAMVCLVFVWKNLGYCAVIYLAGLQSVPGDVLEAAALDGAGAARRFWRITLPLLSPVTFFLLITTILSSLQAFDLIRIMTPLNPGTTTLMYDVYLQAFGGYNRGGYSAALATILFAILVVVTVAQVRFLGRRVHYA